MAVFGAIVAHFTKRRVTDATSGFQAMNRDVLCFSLVITILPTTRRRYVVTAELCRISCDRSACVHEGSYLGVSMHDSWKAIYYIFKMFLAIFIVLLRQSTRSNARRRSQAPNRS